MKRLLPPWALLLLAAIVVFGLLIWFRLQPSTAGQPDDPLATACETLKSRMGLDLAPGATDPAGGVKVKGVAKGSVAEQAGFRAGDRIVACGDQSVWHAYNLLELMSQSGSAGVPPTLLVDRNGTYLPITPGRRAPAPVPPMGDQGP